MFLHVHLYVSFVQQEEAVGSQRQLMQSLLDSIRHQKVRVSSSLLLLEARQVKRAMRADIL